MSSAPPLLGETVGSGPASGLRLAVVKIVFADKNAKLPGSFAEKRNLRIFANPIQGIRV